MRAHRGTLSRARLALLGFPVLLLVVGLKAPDVKHHVTRSIVATSATSTSKLDAAQQWVYQIDEATLSRAANAMADQQPPIRTPLGDLYLRNLAATLRDEELVISANASAGWLIQPVSVTATATAADGRLLVQLRQLTVGPVVVPEWTRRQIEAQLQLELDRALAGQHAVVDTVRIADGSVLLRGTRS